MGMVIGGVLSWARTIGISSVALKIAATMATASDRTKKDFNTEDTESTEKKMLRLMVVLLLFRRGEIFYAVHHFFVFFVGEDAHERHHAHHSGAPVGRQAMRFWLFHGIIHAHFHEGILRKAGHAVCVFRDRGMMYVFEGNAFRERFHLAQSFWVGGIRGFDGAIAEEVH